MSDGEVKAIRETFTDDQEGFERVADLCRIAILRMMEEHIGGPDDPVPTFVTDMMFQALLSLAVDTAAVVNGLPEDRKKQTRDQKLHLVNEVRTMLYRTIFNHPKQATPKQFAADAEARWQRELDQLGLWWCEDDPTRDTSRLAVELGDVLLRLAVQMFLNARVVKKGSDGKMTPQVLRDVAADIERRFEQIKGAVIMDDVNDSDDAMTN